MTDGLADLGEADRAGSSDRAEPGWEDAPRRTSTAEALVLVVDGIEAPLDWLVIQVRAGHFDLATLSIAALMEAFAAALDTAMAASAKEPSDLARWGAWLVLAADLTLLRSQLLVPLTPQAAQDAQERAEALRRQVVHRAEAAALADWLERRGQLGRDMWGRGHPEAKRAGARVGDVTALFRACLPALQVPVDEARALRIATAPVWSVADALARIGAMLPDTREGGAPLAHFLPEIPLGADDYDVRCRAAVATTFLAGLELARNTAVNLSQLAPWTAIQVEQVQTPV